jgi:non-ribosomal peptide synthetase-like protein
MDSGSKAPLNGVNSLPETATTNRDYLSCGDNEISGLGILAVQLYFYSSYLLEKLEIDILRTNRIISLELFLNNEMSASGVNDEVWRALSTQREFPEPPGDLDLIWHFNTDTHKNQYKIKLKHNDGHFSFTWESLPDTFFIDTLHQGDIHYQNVRIYFSTRPDLPISRYSIITEKEKEQIESLSYGPVRPEENKPSLAHEIFENSVRKFPDNKCIQFHNESFTYNQVNEKANRLAHFLVESGVAPGEIVGILLNRSPEYYIAMLAVLKAGAAYLPLDVSYPPDRIKYIIEDSGAVYMLSHSNHKPIFETVRTRVFCLNTWLDETLSVNEPGNLNIHIDKDYPAYIIYTSGTTGMPKGVEISHGALCTLIENEKDLYRLSSEERIAQTFSPAFDASVEEIWIAFSSGCCLYPVTETIMRSGEELASFIMQYQITVLSTVPTMLSMMRPPLSSLKLLILGGENCPDSLVKTWHRSGIRIFNTYGPTEATVISTYDEFRPGRVITIGRPLGNCSVYILSAGLCQVPIGVAGELCIGGKSLATKYINNEEQTRLKFVNPPFPVKYDYPPRIYRSGDLARFNKDGNIEFLGRIDSQIKLRGYRVELSEIESQLKLQPNIRNAVVLVKSDNLKVQRLVAYIVLTDISIQTDETKIKNLLKEKLAGYMIPSMFIFLPELPTLPSGKVDVKRLPEIDRYEQGTGREIVWPANNTEKEIYDVWKEKFAPLDLSVTDDFFDLGGHSLLASLVVSEMRNIEISKGISVKDIYQYRSVRNLASFLDNRAPGKREAEKDVHTEPVSDATYLRTGAAQGISIYIFLLVASIGLISPFAIEKLFPGISNYGLIISSSLLVISTIIAFLLFSVVLKWCVIGRFKPGIYPLWGNYYFRFWLVKKFVDLASTAFLTGTPFINVYFRLLGAKIGRNVYLGTDRIRVFDLVVIGDNSSITKEAHVMGYEVKAGALIIGSIKIGKNCYVGTRSVVSQNSEMKDNSSLGDLSLLQSGYIIPENETWEGSPASETENPKIGNFRPHNENKPLPFPIYLFFQSIGIMFLFMFPLVLIVPFSITYYEIDLNWGFHWTLVAAFPFTAIYIICYSLFVSGLKWILVGKMREDEFSIYSFRYIAKWYVDLVMQETLLVFRFIYATIITPVWLRMMGAKVGKAAEISTVNQISPDLLSIGNGSFLADSVSIGGPVVRNGIMFNRKTTVGNFTFIGNSAVLTCGDKVGDNNLIGVLSVPPRNLTKDREHDSSWLGSPPIFLPVRQESAKFDDKYTFNPSSWLYLKRGFIEFFKITLPFTILSILLISFYKIIYDILKIESLGIVMFTAPVLLFMFYGFTTFIAFAAKKILIGTYKKSNYPLWSWFVWKNELINALCESLVYPLFVSMLIGTPFASWFFRLMGCKIGKKVYLETTEITEFDLVTIGDNACINYSGTIQTHLFEDRVMKMSNLDIQQNCTLGAMSVILYDATLKEGSSVDPLSLIMKGETIPSGTHWAGSPVKCVIV